MIDLTDIPCRTAGFVAEQIDDEFLLYHGGRTTVVYLNQTAFIIWQLCDGTRSAAEVAELFAATFPGDPGAIADDVLTAMQQLIGHGAMSLG